MIEKQPARPYSNAKSISQTIRIIAVILVLTLFCWAAPAIAQEPSKTPIVVDGRELFYVGSSGDFQADERAETIDLQLQQAVESNNPPQVNVDGNSNLPTISLNGTHLLTVTGQDTLPGRTQLDQARIWAMQLDDSVRKAQQERQPAYLRKAALLSIAALSIAVLLHWSLGRSWRRVMRTELRVATHLHESDGTTGLTTPQHPPLTLEDVLPALLLALIRGAIWLGTIIYITHLFPWTRQWDHEFADILRNSLFSPLFTLGNSKYSVTDLLFLAGSFFVLEIVTKTITNLLKSRVLRVAVVNRGAQEAIAIVLRYTLLFIGALVLLQVWGVDISSLTILASALGIGIGFGLQDIAKDIGSGLVLVFERPIQVGDFVQLGDFEGTIERIGARSTLVRTLDHISIIVPNSRFLSHEVINWSHDNPVSRLHLPVGVAYGSDLDAVRSALLEAAKANGRVLTTPRPQVILKEFGDSAINIELLVWTAEPSKQLMLKSELYFNIEAQLRKHHIEIPFPQQDLNIRTGSLPIELSPQLEQTLQQLLKQAQNGRQVESPN